MSHGTHYDMNTHFIALTEQLKSALRDRVFEAGKILSEILAGKEYSHWGTFDAYVSGELRIKPRWAYRLIFAHEMMALLKAHGCKKLPTAERQVRPLGRIKVNSNPKTDSQEKVDALRIEAWTLACVMKNFSVPGESDVHRAVTKLIGLKLDEDMDADYRAFRKRVMKVRSEYRAMVKEVRGLSEFLNLPDKKNSRRRSDTAAIFDEIGVTNAKLLNLFRRNVVPDKDVPQRADWILWRLELGRTLDRWEDDGGSLWELEEVNLLILCPLCYPK
jgi:hypothetical protein